MKPILAAAVLLGALQDGKTDLRWKFQKGQEIRYRVSQNTTIDTAGLTVEQAVRTTYFYAVAGVDEKGTAALTVKYEAVAIKSSGLQELEFDSEKHKEVPADPTAQLISRLVGRSFSLKLGPSGKVLEVAGFDKILDSLFKGSEDDAQMAAQRQALKQAYSDEAMQSMMQQMFMPLPEAPAAKGDSWKTDFALQMPMVGKMRLLGTSRLADVQGTEARLEQEWKMESAPAGEPDKTPAPAPVKLTAVKGKGQATFSTERGLFLTSKTEATMVLAAGGQEMEVRSVNETRLLEGKAEPRKDY
jgi:hypothetical protein